MLNLCVFTSSALLLFALSSPLSAQDDEAKSKQIPPGSEKTTKTKVLEGGANLLQSNAPLNGMDIYLVGIHPMKDHPSQQMEAHHFCKQVNEDFAQCALFDGNDKTANLNGIEYIISEKLFEQLPEAERKFWHPHNFEILSGQLFSPGLPLVAEKELMKKKMNSYGKTWHFWNTGHGGQNTADKLPMGEATLAWSLNHEGEANPALLEATEKTFGISGAKKRQERSDLVKLARPQEGVNALRSQFPGELKSIPGVEEKKR